MYQSSIKYLLLVSSRADSITECYKAVIRLFILLGLLLPYGNRNPEV